MSVYKKFTAQDYAIVPFNAHKQYDFTSTTAASNSVNYYDVSWTSESIDLHTSGNIKYNQLDHLFYRNFKRDISNKFGNTHYVYQKRVLYEKAYVYSIPAGLYGHEIKPGTFFLSSSLGHNIIDDNKGNLIVSGTNVNDYVTDFRTNVLNIGPVNGFKRYDLNTLDGYVSFNGYENSVFYRDGKPRTNRLSSYSTPDFGDEFDDSYFFNVIKYKDVNFSRKPLSHGIFPGIDFNGSTSEVKVGHDDKFNFNPGDDFTITLQAEVLHDPTDTSYLISKSTTKTVVPTPNEGKSGRYSTSATGSLQTKDTFSEPQYPFEIYATGQELFFRRSDGNITTTISSSFETGSMQHISCRVSSSQMEIFINGVGSGISGSDNTVDQTQNQANVYIGNKGGTSNFLSGSLSQINIHNRALTDTQVLNHYSSSNGSPYIGNIFYQNGFVALTHPAHTPINIVNVFGATTIIDQVSITFNSATSVTFAPHPDLDRAAPIAFPIIAGATYRLSASLSDYSGGNHVGFTNQGGVSNLARRTSNGDITEVFVANGDPIRVEAGGNTGGTLSDISIVPIIDDEQIKFQGSHLIYENEYQCTVDEHEFNATTNISARKIKSNQSQDIADFATGSLFKPYVTTIGLYNEDNELLVVGKLGQPIRTSNETDTTFIVRWDT